MSVVTRDLFLTENLRKFIPACQESECTAAIRHKACGCVAFIHDERGRTDEIEISAIDLRDFDLDIWGDQVKPWIKRLHAEASGD
mgnify:CR=1 FL=1